MTACPLTHWIALEASPTHLLGRYASPHSPRNRIRGILPNIYPRVSPRAGSIQGERGRPVSSGALPPGKCVAGLSPQVLIIWDRTQRASIKDCGRMLIYQNPNQCLWTIAWMNALPDLRAAAIEIDTEGFRIADVRLRGYAIARNGVTGLPSDLGRPPGDHPRVIIPDRATWDWFIITRPRSCAPWI